MKWIAFRRSGSRDWQALYQLHVFSTPAQRAHGLSGLAEWPANHAAIFQFAPGEPALIHTQGMRFPIDIVATDGDGYVIGWAEHAQPNDAELFRAPVGTFLVIELAAGEIRRQDIRDGLRIELYDVK